MSVAELDAMPEVRAAGLLRSCCGSARWVTAMLTRRPFGSREVLLAAADSFWLSLSPPDWLEAFAHHPRIGEQTGAVPQTERGRAWSAAEQAAMRAAGDGVRGALAELNRRYEARFGYLYIVCAAGKTPDELLAIARTRMANPAEVELATAAREQQKIMRQRLEQLLR